MIELTSKQILAIRVQMPASCTTVQIQRSSPTATVRAVDVSMFARQRLIQSMRVQPGGGVRVLP